MEEIWGYITEGLFAVFLVSVIGGVATTTGSFNALLYGMFASTAEQNLNMINTTQQYRTTLISSLNTGAQTLNEVSRASGQAFPLATYIVVFTLFIGAVLGIVVGAMSLIARARGAVVVPVKPA